MIWTITAAHTYDEAGTYSYTVTVQDTGGSFTTVTGTAIIADADLTAGATLLQVGNTGVPLVGTGVGSFTDGNPVATTADFTGIIDWGDGSANSVAFFTNTGPGTFDVSGNHTYAKPGVYTVTTNVFDDDGETTTLTASFTDHRSSGDRQRGQLLRRRGPEHRHDRAGDLHGSQHAGHRRQRACDPATRRLGRRHAGAERSRSRSVQIGVDAATGDPIFQVIGSHTYAEEGTFTVNINVTTLGGVTTALTPGTATILDAPLTSSNGTEITGVEGNRRGTVLLGTFTDANQGATVADFTDGARLDRGQLGRRLRSRDLDCRQSGRRRLAQRRDLDRQRRSHLRRGRHLRLHRHGHR